MATTPDGRDRREDEQRERDRRVRRDNELRDRDRSNKERGKATYREERRDRDRNRDKEKERRKDDREKERVRDRGRDKERDKDDRERDRVRDREREKERDKEKDRERRDRDREIKERDNDGEKNRDKVNKDDLDGKKRKERADRDADREANDRRKENEKRENDYNKQRRKDSSTGKDSDIETPVDEHKEKPKGPQKKRQDEDDGQKDRDEGWNREDAGSIAIEGQGPARKERGEGSVNEIAAWVNRSRKLEEQKKIEEKIKAARMARMLEEQENREDEENEEYRKPDVFSGTELAGLKVRHGLEKLIEGGAVTFTLKDKSILEGDDLNEEVDDLENIEIAQQQARTEAYRAAKKMPGIYEDKFQNDINSVAAILPRDELEMKDEGITLDDFGSIGEETQKKLQDIRSRLQGVSIHMEISLDDRNLNLASDYFTQEEMIHFNKPQKKKRLRKKQTLDIAALEAEAIAEGLVTEDHGSRSSGKRLAAKQEEERAAEASRKVAYELAFAKAIDSSRKLREGNAGAESHVTDQEELIFGGEDDDELYKSLRRAREAALKKQRANGLTGTGPQAVITALKQTVQPHVETIIEPADKEKVILTDTEEFCRSLQLEDAVTRKSGPKDSFVEQDEVVINATIKEDLQPTADGGWREVKETDDQRLKEKEKTDDDDEDDLEEPIKECTLGKGLAGALQLLKERGNLKETVDWGGRNMDKKKSKLVGITGNPETKSKFKDIQLDRHDEFGRTMTPKEAFRQLSHKFHGKGPGKMKLEKRVKQYQEEMKLKQMNAGDTPLMSMEKMREAQAKMHTPYIILSGPIKPGQTSDLRSSGFGIVEKEQIGSLTPMLGDRKVEHFLGIKRKPESKSMGPPPPKKPKAG